MKHNIAELEGALLDAAVAKVEGRAYKLNRASPSGDEYVTVVDHEMADEPEVVWSPSRHWGDGGPILERERILLSPLDAEWRAVHTPSGESEPVPSGLFGDTGEELLDRPPLVAAHGPAPLVAAMRAYVASKFGEEVELLD